LERGANRSAREDFALPSVRDDLRYAVPRPARPRSTAALETARGSPRWRGLGIFEILQKRNFEFLKCSQIAIWNVSRNQICKFREIENEKVFRERSRQNRKEESRLDSRGSLQI
jgi:hypothetical protein